MLEMINSRPFALATYSFLNNTLSSNFDRYLNDVLNEVSSMASKKAYQKNNPNKYLFDRK